MTPAVYDAVVIGSGFGGAVVATRLAEAGRSVVVLEQGRRWSPAEFPHTFGRSSAAVWDEQSLGFLDYRVFARVDVIQGVGVGGGSIPYFNVQLRAPAAIFERPGWPAVVKRPLLDRYYERVEAVTTPAPLVPPAGDRLPARTEAFLRGAAGAGYSPELLPIAVHTGDPRAHPLSGLSQLPCNYSSSCMLGCRGRSKNSLEVTYLPHGERNGLEIRPLHQVERIAPAAGRDGYEVTVRRLDPDGSGAAQRGTVTGRTVVVTGGSLGSTELLLRARDRDRTLPRLPAALGRRFSANGEMLFAGTSAVDDVVDGSHGPSITAGAYVQRPGSPHVLLLEDLGFPPAFMSLLDGTIPGLGRLRALGRVGAGYAKAARRGSLFPTRELFGGSFVPHFLPYLGMGTDAANGQFRLDEAGNLRLDWDPTRSAGMYAEMEEALRRISAALGGTYRRSVLFRRPLKRMLTAHPLGGCVMSDRPEDGVVNDRGEVWGHPGLYVADGAVIPGPLAANPSLTIAAVAERIAQWMVHGREAA
ncbi:MAG: GMC oxidoreductase [Acidimicrobiia bacterium]